MIRLVLAAALVLASAVASAQQTSVQQRLRQQIGAFVIENVALATQIDQLQARIKQLEDKYEPKEPKK